MPAQAPDTSPGCIAREIGLEERVSCDSSLRIALIRSLRDGPLQEMVPGSEIQRGRVVSYSYAVGMGVPFDFPVARVSVAWVVAHVERCAL